MKFSTILLLGLVTLASTKPIMVTFGTNQGPIVPREKSIPQTSRSAEVRSPAPVSEETEDVPNPLTYRPIVPHQYRTKIYSQKPLPSLILGTPLDQKYTPSDEKFDIYKKQGRTVGVDYTGPHIFEKQAYEFEAKKLRPAVRFIKPHHYEQEKLQQDDKSVPQIGIVYSAGVRYYVPQLVYDAHKQDEEQENSVYDSKDEKHVYREKEQ
ncbi:hypothetical protein BDFB_010727 [Asbolus verrucosus]|uniref:Uncharacterized protein n=1 Tax=Asbolus verrucosus TaxID=1661398 RepID=A0A482VRJ3_ASBVE|nr:hypothetical protein BDFB_010727 [Asbolus verrucosus]